MKRSPPAARLGAMVLLAATFLGGCVSRPQPLYYWGDYQSQVYGHFQGEKGAEEQIQALEKVREQARSAGKQLPPGLQAHLAMLYGQTGRSELFLAQLESEKRQFPESATFMDFLLKKFTP